MDKIKLNGEKQRYAVQARNERYIVLTKPFNAKKTYLYTIVDLERGVRGPCNLIFGLPFDVDNPDGAKQAIDALQSGEMQVSFRRCVVLSPDEVTLLRACVAQAPANQTARTSGDISATAE